VTYAPRPAHLALVLLLLAMGGCKAGGGANDPDAAADDPSLDARAYEPPRDDLVSPAGSDATIDIATWNIENFPATEATPRLVADLIASLDLDLVAVEEIADTAAFAELVARLPEHEGVLSSHTYGNGTYQKVGFIYRADLFELGEPTLLFTDQGFDFPRPPLAVEVALGDRRFTAVVVHLKAGVEAEDRERRAAALTAIEAYLRTIEDGAGDPDVVVLGDFNQPIVSEVDDAVWAPIVGAPERYAVLTEALADDGEASYLPFGGKLIDHLVVTAGFELGAADVVVPHLQDYPLDYTDTVSDHLPVVARFPR
jgi:endonuclease/exonuclease/phosphatase family metal-dependent hydrolase